MKLARCKNENIVKNSSSARALRFAQVACLLSLTALAAIPALGDIAFGVSPMEAQLKVPQHGKRVTDDIEVYNSGDVPIHVVGYVMDWTLTRTGEIRFDEPGSHSRSCARWIQMNPVQFNLAPKKTVRVRYTVTAPEEPGEEYWAMIFFQSRPQAIKGTGLNISVRVGCKVFVVPAQKQPRQGAITDMVLQQAPTSNLKVTFANTGRTHVRVSGTFEVRGEDGQVMRKGELLPPASQVLAGSSRELLAELEQLPPGSWRIRATLDYGGKEFVSGDLKVESDPGEDRKEGDGAKGK